MNLKHAMVALAAPLMVEAQEVMTPEVLWSLNRMSVSAVSPDQSSLIYKVSRTDLATEKSKSTNFLFEVATRRSSALDLGKKSLIQWDKNGLYAKEGDQIYLSKDAGKSWEAFYTLPDAVEIKISPDGKQIAFSREVQVETVYGKEKYGDVPHSTAQIYTDLNHRHWDRWNEGRYNHVFVVGVSQPVSLAKDLLEGKAWDSPQRPFGGSEDFVWSPDSSELLYVVKPLSGAAYVQSTNTDIFAYHLASGKVRNLTEENKGYDNQPIFSPDGKYLLYTSMKRDGFEADKNDIKLIDWKTGRKSNLTEHWDESVTGGLAWSSDSKTIYYTAAFRGTKQLFSLSPSAKKITQITKGDFDVNAIYADYKNTLVVSRNDMNHNADLFSVNLKGGKMEQVTAVNAETYAKIKPSKTELRMVETTDGKSMGVWFIYPPDFDETKKYPTLVYCQGGPQSALTQTFSIRWNFALMAAQGYIVVAPNRRGMPGWGTQWNEAISKDWGGQPIRDYLSATDYAKTLPFVDGDRMAAVGASYGGYSVYMLAGVHGNRFKSFIAHNGLYDMKSWYGTTEELFFANWDIGSPWETPTPKAYTEFNPSLYSQNWNAPIMIIQGGLDFRVPYEQGNQAFQTARLKGLKSKFLYYPDENHWVLNAHNALVWQREFFGWLKETL
ncbi:S9 family peptidase [Bergeyella sp. RCAD1439]|uniref:S9 family peptidase n=1 Tax=Bergeyella anatis TaxID=3113737 RepID=UPI002E19A1E5|nr:S9 family peptidase [Bergeyella sp. RCAD1439]